jgi:hypothetical protein
MTTSSALPDSHIPETAASLHAFIENLKHPGFFATRDTTRFEPPVIVVWDSKGVFSPKSKMKPVLLELVCQVMVVPAFTQKGPFPFASAMLGVADAP